MMCIRIKARYQIVSQMMLGGCNGKNDNIIRPASFKGVLRFWWRALNWPKYPELSQLHEKECRLFGGVSDSGGQGVFLFSIISQSLERGENASKITEKGLQYLLVGVNGEMNSPDRSTIKAGGYFNVEFFCKPGVTEEDKNSLKDALLALGLFGGLGAKSRKGFGSLAIEMLDGEKIDFSSSNAYYRAGKKLLNRYLTCAVRVPPYTALSSGSQWYEMASTHAQLANEYRTFLTEHQKKGNGKLEFGEPRLKHSQSLKDRRGSPLFMHIHPIGKESVVACLLFLPAVWTKNKPEGDKNYGLVKTYLKKCQKQLLWKGAQ